MVFPCEHCARDVGEESCLGCRVVIPFYMCSRCKKPTWNPRYKSGVECPKCKRQVIQHFQKSMRYQISHYVCNHCGAIVENPTFKNYSSCLNCTPRCKACNGYLATNEHLDYSECVACGKHYGK